MGSIYLLFLLSITYSCPAHFFSCWQDSICPPLSNCSLCYSHISSLCASIMYLVPCQRYHFLPHLPSHCFELFGSCLSKDSLGMGQHTSFLVTDFLLPILYFVYLGEINKALGGAIISAQHQHSSGLQKTTRKGEEVGQSSAARHHSSFFWFLPKSTGSSSLLPHDTHKHSKDIRLLHCRSSALDHKAEHGSWYLMHEQIFSASRATNSKIVTE